MRELDVCMFECEFIFGKLFETDYDVLCGCFFPGSFGDEGCADSGEFGVIKDADGGVLYVDFVAGFDELGCVSMTDMWCRLLHTAFVVFGVSADLCSRGLLSERRWRVVGSDMSSMVFNLFEPAFFFLLMLLAGSELYSCRNS